MPLPPEATAGSALRERRPLELFFPFDPYLLRRSAQHLRLRETYVRWSRGHSTARPGEAPPGGAVEGEDVQAEESHSEEEETASLLQDSSDEEDDVVGSSLEMAMSPPMPPREGPLRMLSSHPSLGFPASTQPRPIPVDSDLGEELEGMSASPYGKSIPMLSCSMASGQRVPMTTLNTS